MPNLTEVLDILESANLTETDWSYNHQGYNYVFRPAREITATQFNTALATLQEECETRQMLNVVIEQSDPESQTIVVRL